MVAYEVQTEDLLGIRDQLAAQADLVATSSTGVASATSTMLQEMDTGLIGAQTTIDALLQELAGTVTLAGSAAAGADWLGADAETFRAANGDLMAAIARSQGQLEAAIAAHQTATVQLGSTLLGTLDQFTAEAGRSRELTAQLSVAVGLEADSYEQAFNGSWNAGAGAAAATAPPGAPGAPPPAGEGEAEEEDDWDGIDDPDKEWRKGKEWERRFATGEGRHAKPPGDDHLDPIWEKTLLDENPVGTLGKVTDQFGDETGVHGSWEVDAARAEGKLESKFGLDAQDGLFASAAVGGTAALGAFQGKAEYGIVTAQGQGYAAGVEASADGKLGIGPDGARATINAEAFAGFEAEGEISGEYSGVTAGVGGEISVGIGAHADVDASFTTERIGASVDVGATLGVGAGIKFDVSVNPKEVLDSLGDLFD